VDQAAQASQLEFSGRNREFGASLGRALQELSAGAEPDAVLEALQEEAERAQQNGALAALYAELVTGDGLGALPERARLELYLQAAWLCAQQHLEGATLRAACAALSLAPAEERALALAEPLLLEGERYDDLSRLYVEAAAASESQERTCHLLEHAVRLLSSVPAAAPAVSTLNERLERAKLTDGEHALLAAVRLGSVAERDTALVELGEHWLVNGKASFGLSLLELEPEQLSSDAALDVLERLFDQAEDLPHLTRTLQRRVALSETPMERGRWLEKLAALRHEQGDTGAACTLLGLAAQNHHDADQAEDAQRVYEQLLELCPQDQHAATQLVLLRAAAGNLPGAALAFDALLETAVDGQALAELLLAIRDDAARASAVTEFSELADNVRWRLSEHQGELGSLLLRESALLFASDARYDEAAELFQRLLNEHGAEVDLQAFRALIDNHPSGEWRQQQQRWLFDWREQKVPDRAALLLEWARFEEHEVGDPRAALGVLARAAELEPERADIWEQLLRLTLSEGDGRDAAAAAAALHRLGREVDDSLLGALLEAEPTLRWALDRRALALSAAQRWSELLAIYERAIDATVEPEQKAALLDEAAVAARDVAQDPARALTYWELYCELVPGDARVEGAMERLYTRAGDRRGLIDHTRRRLTGATGAGRTALLGRLAELSLEQGELEDVLDAAEQLRATGADGVDALLDRVLAHGLEAGTCPSSRRAGRRAAMILRGLRSAPESAPERARLLRAELALVDDDDERHQLLNELSRLCEEELSDLDAACSALREAFVVCPREASRERLERLSERTSSTAELCEAYAQAARRLDDEAYQRALLLRAAELAEFELREPERALALYRCMYELRPETASDELEGLRARRSDVTTPFDALCCLLDDSGRFEELARCLAREAEREGSPRLLRRLGRLQAQRLGLPERAIATYLAADDAEAAAQVFLQAGPAFGDEPELALRLGRRLEGAGQPELARRVLAQQLEAYEHQSPAARKRVQLELVRVSLAMGDTAAAARELSDASKRYPTCVEVKRACAAAAALRGDFTHAEQCYRALLLLLHGAEAEGSRAPVYAALAEIKRRKQEHAAADDLLASAFEAALGSGAELRALVECLVQAEQWTAAERACHQLLAQPVELRSANSTLRTVAKVTSSGRASPDLATAANQAALSLLSRLDELPSAAERSSLLLASIELMPLASAAETFALHRPELLPGDSVAAELALAARRLSHEGEAEVRQATEALERLVASPDAPSTTWGLLARALLATGRPEKSAQALARWVELEPRDRHALEQALASALSRADLALALNYADGLQGLGFSPSPALGAELCRQCIEARDTSRAVTLLVRYAAQERQQARRASLLVQAAELLLADGERVAAFDLAREAQSLDPGSSEAVLVLARLALADDERERALSLLSEHAGSKERRRGQALARALRLAADLHLERDELAEALAWLQEAHQMDKGDLDTALLLGLLAVDLDRLETAASALRGLIAQRELGAHKDAGLRSRELGSGYLQLARIEQHHGKKTNAKRMALRALEEDPSLVAAELLMKRLATA
jgi:hypothetical protein